MPHQYTDRTNSWYVYLIHLQMWFQVQNSIMKQFSDLKLRVAHFLHIFFKEIWKVLMKQAQVLNYPDIITMRPVKLREINCQSTLTLTWRLEQNGWHFANNILKCISLKMWVFLFKFHWNLFMWVQLRMAQHLLQVMDWCCQVTSHHLNQCWPISMMITMSYPHNIQEWEAVNAFTVSLHSPSGS